MKVKKFKLLNGFTLSQVIDMIYKGNKGRVARSNGSGGCVYLTGDGNKCAIGCFIPDGHPGQKHGGFVGDLLSKHPDLTSKMPLSLAALRYMQSLHDRHVDSQDPRPAMVDWLVKNVSRKADD